MTIMFENTHVLARIAIFTIILILFTLLGYFLKTLLFPQHKEEPDNSQFLRKQNKQHGGGFQ